MSSIKTNTQVIYKQIPAGLPVPNKDFEINKSTIDLDGLELKPNQLLIRNLYLSVDPYMRARMRDPKIKSYSPAVIPGQPMNGGVVAEIIKSTDAKYAAGEIIVGFANWEEYTVIDTSGAAASGFGSKVIPGARENKIPLSYYLGVLGMPGLTAYIGLHKICQPLKSNEKQQTLYVSAAAGAVGQVVGQYGKSLGLRVVGSAGDDAKVDYLLNELNFDAAFNYKKHVDFKKILKEKCPNGIDIYFENVGGKMLDAVLAVANDFARIAVCGMISQYNRPDNPEPIYGLALLISKRIRMEGFIVSDNLTQYAMDGLSTFSGLIKDGKMKYRETVTDGIENAPKAFVDMLEGRNLGKAVVKVADL
jgi:NADPH-dependent curcumin reductase CurA